MIRRLERSDLEDACSLVARVVAGMGREGIDQWDAVYPDRVRLAADLESEEAWGAFADGRLCGYVVLNTEQSPEYEALPWADDCGPVFVVHRLCVDPAAAGRGLGRGLLAHAEDEAVRRGGRSVRLDAYSLNPRALALYEQNGYTLRGQVTFRKGVFHCYEKALFPLEAALSGLPRGAPGGEVVPITGSFGKQLYAVDGRYLVRTSRNAMDAEAGKIGRAAGLGPVPRLLRAGQAEGWHFLVLDLLPGTELQSSAAALDPAAQDRLGREVSDFLDSLHRRRGETYDIGLYLPTLPNFEGTWRQGHERYWEGLLAQLANVPLGPRAREAVAAAGDAWGRLAGALDHQSGPCLVHNDFHLKNLLVDQGRLSGVIDWECSQFAEPDFDLVHLVHWNLFPPHGPVGAEVFTRTVLREQLQKLAVPRLADRLAVYQIEQDFCQLIWGGGRDQEVRADRLDAWVSGRAESVLSGLPVGEAVTGKDGRQPT